MEEINAYIKNIAVFNVLMIFADFIMPDSFSKKYVSFIKTWDSKLPKGYCILEDRVLNLITKRNLKQ